MNTCPVCSPYPRKSYQQLCDGREVACYACNRTEFYKEALTQGGPQHGDTK